MIHLPPTRTSIRKRSVKEVITGLVGTRGVLPGERAVPLALAWPMAAAMEAARRDLPLSGEPPLTRQTLRMVGHEFTLDTYKVRRGPGCAPIVGWDEGLARMRAAVPSHPAARTGSGPARPREGDERARA